MTEVLREEICREKRKVGGRRFPNVVDVKWQKKSSDTPRDRKSGPEDQIELKSQRGKGGGRADQGE